MRISKVHKTSVSLAICALSSLGCQHVLHLISKLELPASLVDSRLKRSFGHA